MLPCDLLLSCTCTLIVSIPHSRSLCGYQAVTIGARDENTKALLLSKMSKDVSMTMPPEPKLSYTGPMYLGNNNWNSDGEILSSAAAKKKLENGKNWRFWYKNSHFEILTSHDLMQAPRNTLKLI